jgi:hypothetical protein
MTMTGSKPWYMSKTLWGIIIAFIAAVAGAVGIQPVEQLPDWATGIISMIGLIVAYFGRVNATKKIA